MKPYCFFCAKVPDYRDFMENYYSVMTDEKGTWIGKYLKTKDETFPKIPLPENSYEKGRVYLCSRKCLISYREHKPLPRMLRLKASLDSLSRSIDELYSKYNITEVQ